MEIKNRVRAPELPSNYPWLNTDQPLALKELKGRIIILDFWTYCCINCLHILPDLKYLENKYKNHLTVIGVHSAKFDNEKEIENIRQAILRYDIEHPVLVDKGFSVWQQYVVKAWPTLVLIDPEGYYLGSLAGEGNREALDDIIAKIIDAYKNETILKPAEIKLSLEKTRNPLNTPLAFPGKILATNIGLFISDSGHNRIIWTTPEGKVLEIIGSGIAGFKDGNYSDAQFFAPQGITYDENNNSLYVADTENHAIRKIDLKTKSVETIAGTGNQSHNIKPHSGKAKEIQLNSPWDIELNKNCLYIAMAGSHQIWQIELETGKIGTYSGTGAEYGVDGQLNQAAFAQPSGITSDGNELFIADSEISSIRGVGLGSNTLVRTICGSGELFSFGDKDGHANEVLLQHCLGVDYAQNYLWIADTYNHKIKKIDHRTGLCNTILGDGIAGYKNGVGRETRFFEPSGLSAIGSHLYVADTNNHAIRHIDLNTLTVTTLEISGLCTPDICTTNNS
ncbi:MAG TPA: thioredoxin-like domain-containing protein [Halomicronema sp.]